MTPACRLLNHYPLTKQAILPDGRHTIGGMRRTSWAVLSFCLYGCTALPPLQQAIRGTSSSSVSAEASSSTAAVQSFTSIPEFGTEAFMSDSLQCSKDSDCVALHGICGKWKSVNKRHADQWESYYLYINRTASCVPFSTTPTPSPRCQQQRCQL